MKRDAIRGRLRRKWKPHQLSLIEEVPDCPSPWSSSPPDSASLHPGYGYSGAARQGDAPPLAPPAYWLACVGFSLGNMYFVFAQFGTGFV